MKAKITFKYGNNNFAIESKINTEDYLFMLKDSLEESIAKTCNYIENLFNISLNYDKIKNITEELKDES